MEFQARFNHVAVVLFILLLTLTLLSVEAKRSKPTEKIRGKKPSPKQCGTENDSAKCSPPVAHRIKATLTINSFQKGGDGGGPSACDGKFHSDDIRLVALPTAWFRKQQRCHKNVRIFGNGKEVTAMVVDECVCRSNLLDASKAVWKALGVPQKDWGELDVFWSDA